MPTTLGKAYQIDWRGDPPHMLKPDIPVWYRFLAVQGPLIHKLYYDCLVGGEFYTDEQLKDPMTRMWRQNTAKRLDALAEMDTEAWIIEVAADPGLRSLGQLFTYQTLWIRDPQIAKPERLVLVCDTIEKDLLDAAGMRGISVILS